MHLWDHSLLSHHSDTFRNYLSAARSDHHHLSAGQQYMDLW